jgi:conjugative transfer pilus assembly protein TraH
MKKILISSLVCISLSNADMQNYLNNTIKANYEEAGSYKGQVRGAYSLGAVKIKYGVSSNYNPINIQLPSLKMGCGGIDATFGSFSVLNEEYLINFLKSVMAQAPAFLWQLALSTLDKDTQTIINELQKAVAAANAFNLDACATSQKLFDYSKSFFEDGVQSSLNAGATDDSIAQREKSSIGQLTDYINSANSFFNDTDKTKEALDKKVFLGSLLEQSFKKSEVRNIFGEDGQGGYLLEGIMRYIIGDIAGYKLAKGSDDFTYDIKVWARGTETQIKEFVHGGKIKYLHLQANPDNMGEPTDNIGEKQFDGIKKIFEDNLATIVSKMLTKQKMSTSERQFINSLPVPIYRFLNTTATHTSEADVTILAEFISIIETKALLDWIIESVANSIRKEVSTDNKESQEKRILIAKNAVEMKQALDIEYSQMKKDFESKTKLLTYYKSLEAEGTGTRKNLW